MEVILLELYAFLGEETEQGEARNIVGSHVCVCVSLQRKTSVNRAWPLFFHQVRFLGGEKKPPTRC